MNLSSNTLLGESKLVLLLSVNVLVLILVSNHPEGPNLVPSSFSQVSNFTAYSSDRLNIVFDYPKDWIYSEKQSRFESNSIYDLLMGDEFHLVKIQLPLALRDMELESKGLENYTKNYFLNLISEGAAVIEGTTSSQLARYNSTSFLTVEDVPLLSGLAASKYIFVEKNGQLYTLVYQISPPQSFDTAESKIILDRIMKTFEFLN
jgi:hypothetical protein